MSSCVTFTFLPSSSCVPWVSTLSTLFGSLNVTKPKPLQVDLEGDVNRRRLARSSANIYPSQEPSNWTWTRNQDQKTRTGTRKTERAKQETRPKVEPAIVSLARAPIRRSNYIKILLAKGGCSRAKRRGQMSSLSPPEYLPSAKCPFFRTVRRQTLTSHYTPYPNSLYKTLFLCPFLSFRVVINLFLLNI